MAETNSEPSLDRLVQALSAPFCGENFVLYRQGISESPDTSVYVNDRQDFALLFPRPEIDYHHYQPRFKALNLDAYRTRNEVVERRFRKIESYFTGQVSVLEIGAFDGAFLQHARARNDRVRLASLEVDARSASERGHLTWLKQYSDFAEVTAEGGRFDLVCAFHVLEHIVDPADFLRQCRGVLGRGGRLIIEVPSLDDPLLKLYGIPEYEAFYFQRQHPYVYSASSLSRLLETQGFRVQRCISHQRYGLENHLTWLAKRRPGGDEALREIFSAIDHYYRERLEALGLADAVIVVAEDAGA